MHRCANLLMMPSRQQELVKSQAKDLVWMTLDQYYPDHQTNSIPFSQGSIVLSSCCGCRNGASECDAGGKSRKGRCGGGPLNIVMANLYVYVRTVSVII